jgi:hypothetical protein
LNFRLNRRLSAALVLLLSTLTIVTLAVSAESTTGPGSGDKPEYTSGGALLFPKDFKKWIFVGSNLGLSYKKNLPTTTLRETARLSSAQFHNVYISPTAYFAFVERKVFPDGTMLVMEVFEAADKEPKGVLASGVFNGSRSGVEVAVKNSQRPDGKTTPWAYYDFTDAQDGTRVIDGAKAFDDNDCETCHRAHASIDNVWVQFYPTLRDAMSIR